MTRKSMMAPVILALVLGGAAAVVAHAQVTQTPPPDALSDPSLKGPEVISFIGVKPGDKIADIFAGRFVRAFSQAVGPNGKVYAVEPAEFVKAEKQGQAALDGMKAMAAAPGGGNILVSSASLAALSLPTGGLDEVFIRQNYHDLYDPFLGPADVPSFNKQVFAALKPGGVFIVLDHSAPAGSGLADTNTTHRIDEERVKADMKAAGFLLDGESKIFANPADDRTKLVFNPAIRGKTDQFLLKFRKPR
jgi:predicted methyltransferase